jgi:O-acetyl-ADP-ribose deacetylase (regulator of RNase III)
MLKQVSGDILLSHAQAIAHGVAPNDPFNVGLALSLREHWPAMYKDFRHYCQTRHPKAGELWTWATPDGRRIVSLFTQDAAYNTGEKPGRAHTEHVNHALAALRKLAESEGLKSIALPRLATGVGGLDWADVEPLIQRHLDGLGVPVLVYSTFRKNEAAAEEL